MNNAQPGILAPLPPHARYLTFGLKPGATPRAQLKLLSTAADGKACVVGIGALLAFALQKEIEGLKPFPHYRSDNVEVPSTPAALWCWLRGDDRGEILLRARRTEKMLAPAFEVTGAIDAFRYERGLDLTGYEDGTENPKGRKAVETAIVNDKRPGFGGASFVAVQQWVHDLDAFAAMPQKRQDDAIGRRRRDNKELASAPESAHVKRTAQESFTPEAFVWRRSMPWADGAQAGLNFVAFGRSLDAFDAQLKRMAGAEDGIVDALFTFTRPVTGAYYWCPPVRGKKLDLRAIGL
ncbi:MAG TPA: Dyp-type peroxidase [Burkholderiales bacterium]|nr:Dyp-type peroxidase [Burkholderiales bacterium]